MSDENQGKLLDEVLGELDGSTKRRESRVRPGKLGYSKAFQRFASGERFDEQAAPPEEIEPEVVEKSELSKKGGWGHSAEFIKAAERTPREKSTKGHFAHYDPEFKKFAEKGSEDE